MPELTWETEADWDAAQNSQRVAHNDIGDRAGDEIWLGYDPDEIGDVLFYYPFHEDSGSTLNEFIQGNDGTYNGPTLGQEGILSATAPSWNGTDDEATAPHHSGFDMGQSASAIWWGKINDLNTENNFFRKLGAFTVDHAGGDSETDPKTIRMAFGNNYAFGSDLILDGLVEGAWHFYTVTWDGITERIYLDGVLEESDDRTDGDMATSTNQIYFGANEEDSNTERFLGGQMSDLMFINRTLSDSEISDLHQASQDGTLTTAAKTA